MKCFGENLIYEKENSWNMVVAFQGFFFSPWACNYYANITAVAKDLCHELLCNRAKLLNIIFQIDVSMTALIPKT